MSAPYSEADLAFDLDQQGIIRCPKHGTRGCACCQNCGLGDNKHDKWCPMREPEPFVTEPHPCLSTLLPDGSGAYCSICGNTLQ